MKPKQLAVRGAKYDNFGGPDCMYMFCMVG